MVFALKRLVAAAFLHLYVVSLCSSCLLTRRRPRARSSSIKKSFSQFAVAEHGLHRALWAEVTASWSTWWTCLLSHFPEFHSSTGTRSAELFTAGCYWHTHSELQLTHDTATPSDSLWVSKCWNFIPNLHRPVTNLQTSKRWWHFHMRRWNHFLARCKITLCF